MKLNTIDLSSGTLLLVLLIQSDLKILKNSKTISMKLARNMYSVFSPIYTLFTSDVINWGQKENLIISYNKYKRLKLVRSNVKAESFYNITLWYIYVTETRKAPIEISKKRYRLLFHKFSIKGTKRFVNFVFWNEKYRTEVILFRLNLIII